nr:PepSY-associated TM helix domain-containing protein [Verrucomicrobium spinosum]
MPSPDQSTLHRWLWRWHGYAGLFVIPFLFFMSLTGLPYVWQHELEDWLHPEYRA